MSGYVVNLTDYTPPARYDGQHWTQAQIFYSVDNVAAYTLLTTVALSPLDADPTRPLQRSFTVNAPTASGWLQVVFLDAVAGQAPTNAVQYPVATGHGQANPTTLSARYGVRHRIRDGIPLLDANPQPFNMVRLENLVDEIPQVSTPVQTVFQVLYSDVPTQRYINVQAIPGTLVAYLDGSWTPVTPSVDVDQNGNFTLPIPPVQQLLVTYGWQYFSDGEIDQFVDEGRQWLREFSSVTQIPDGLVPALISYASFRALDALASTAANLPSVKAGDSDIDWSKLSGNWAKQAARQESRAEKERLAYYTQGPEALDPSAVDVFSPTIHPYEPRR